MATRRSVERRVSKALKKYLRQTNAGPRSTRKSKKHMIARLREHWPTLSKAQLRRERDEINKIIRSGAAKSGVARRANPVKGRKVKGGRSVTLRNFSGTIVKKADGTVQILGKGKRK